MVETIEQQAVNTIRVLAADLTRGANSGHPGGSVGYLAHAFVLLNPSCRRTNGMRAHGSRPVYKISQREP